MSKSKPLDTNKSFDKLLKISSEAKYRKDKAPGALLQDNDIIEPGVETFYKEEWIKLPENSLVMHKPVALVKMIDPNSIYRYPLSQESPKCTE